MPSRETPSRARRWRARHALVCAAGAAGLLAVALSGVGGSYAMWNDAASVDAGTLTAGTAGIAASWSGGQPDAAGGDLLPGESVRRAATVSNTGATSLMISAAAVGSAGFEVRVGAGGCPAGPLGGPAGDGRSQATGVTLTPGAATVVCVEVRATAAAIPAQSVAFTVRFDGMQVAR